MKNEVGKRLQKIERKFKELETNDWLSTKSKDKGITFEVENE
jgi:ribosome-associated translation inhibitor RaiA